MQDFLDKGCRESETTLVENVRGPLARTIAKKRAARRDNRRHTREHTIFALRGLGEYLCGVLLLVFAVEACSRHKRFMFCFSRSPLFAPPLTAVTGWPLHPLESMSQSRHLPDIVEMKKR